MPYIHVRKYRRGKSYVRRHRRRINRIPQKLGTTWIGKDGKYIHGPRILQPGKFKSVYIQPIDWVRKRKRHITNYGIIAGKRLRKGTKIKIGELKKHPKKKNLTIQSFITPNHQAYSRFIKKS